MNFNLHPAYTAAIPLGVLSIAGSCTAVGMIFAAATATSPITTAALAISACTLALFSSSLFTATVVHAKHAAANLAPYQFSRARFHKNVIALTGEQMAHAAANMGWGFARRVIDQLAKQLANRIIYNLFGRCR